MIFKSDIGNFPVEYIRHKKLGDMPVSTYGDGLKKVLAISNAIARAAGGVLLFDEIETSMHKKYYDDVFRFTALACKNFDVQLFITSNYSVTLRNPQFLHKVEKWEGSEKNQRNVNIQEEKKVVC